MIAVHLLNYTSDEKLSTLGDILPQLAEAGINTLILEVDYSFEFQSHPELRQGDQLITKAGARQFSDLCKLYKIRLIPEFQCLGHQSWAKQTFPQLTKYPELDVTPGAFPNNDSIYCREWDPTNQKVYEIIFPLLDEIIDAFQATAFHVGMDEVFLLGHKYSPTTLSKVPAELFSKAVNDLHSHLVTRCGVEMLMWGDRLIESPKYSAHAWEASQNGTWPAVNMILKDIIICPWHYEAQEEYPSIPMFLEKGFRVLPAGWKNEKATKALINYSFQQKNPHMLGYLFTIWSAKLDTPLDFPTIGAGLDELRRLKKAGILF